MSHNSGSDAKALRAVWCLLRRHLAEVLVALLAMSAASAGLLALPLAVRKMLEASLGPQPVAPSVGSLGVIAVLLCILAVAAYLSSVFLQDVSRKVCAELREAFVGRWLRASVAAQRDLAVGEFGERLTTSLADVDWFIRASLGHFLGMMVLMVGGGFMLFWTNWKLALVTLLALPFCVLALRAIERRSRALLRERRNKSESLAGMLQGAFLGLEVVKAFNAEKTVIGEFRRRQEPLLAVQLRESLVASLVEPVLIATGAVTFLLIVFFAATFMARGSMTAPELFTFLVYLMFILPNLRTLGLQLARWRHLRIALDFLDDVSRIPPEEESPRAVVLPDGTRGQIEFRDVCFSHPGRPRVLQNVSFSAAPGERVGIVGASGVGKSTMFHLLLRFFDATSGFIFLDGQDITQCRRASLRRVLAYVPQDPMLLDGSILDNVRLGNPAANHFEVVTAIEAARAGDFIASLPDGLDTQVGERGLKLSAGQRQRLAIARALIKDAPVLLLDEATSAMDPRTEKLFAESIRSAMQGRTALVIAHRLATIVQLPRLVFIHEGRVADYGTHEELMARCPDYRAVVGASLV
jgi:ATP-binding cassette subfamily B protein